MVQAGGSAGVLTHSSVARALGRSGFTPFQDFRFLLGLIKNLNAVKLISLALWVSGLVLPKRLIVGSTIEPN